MPAKIDGRTKKAVLKFIADFKGRGGISAAARKYKISRMTIMRWLKSEPGVNSKAQTKAGRPPKAIVKVRKARKVRRTRKAAKAPVTAKVVRRRGRPPKTKVAGMKAFAEGLIAIADLQAQIAAETKKLAAVVA